MWNRKAEDRILFEDKEIIVCHKPAGLAVQNARIGAMDLESMLKNYLSSCQEGKIPYLAVVHRLDQPVEGVIVFAKTKKAAQALSRQISEGKMKKEYLAVTAGRVEKEEGTLEDFLKKDGRTNTSTVVKEGTPGGKRSILQYQVVDKAEDEEGNIKYLLHILLGTGRHHQIRVQMAHGGMALLGDRKYGDKMSAAGSLGLCAAALTFVHPSNGKEMCFQVKPEGDAFQDFKK